MTKQDAKNKLEALLARAKPLVSSPSGSQEFRKWYRDTEIAIERIFGEQTRHSKDFTDVEYSLTFYTNSTPESKFTEAYRQGVCTAISIIESFIDEVEEYWSENEENIDFEVRAVESIVKLIDRFHQIARQLQSRHAGRPTIEIDDEYDVQDLFHGLLKIYFDDVRPEEYTPSYAGSSSRVDFLLKQEKIIIEIKKTRKNLKAKEIGEQLIIDSQRYQSHPDCGQLICFVYDPEGRVANPRGIENDLTKDMNGVPVAVYITPKQ